MNGYLDNFGAADAKRERTFKRFILAGVALVIAGIVGYFLFRNYKEESQVKAFVEALRGKRYQDAYRMFGCTEATPCRDYSFDRFQEDWGEKSKHKDPGTIQIAKVKSCTAGIIQTIRWDGEEILLWVNRADLTVGFAPWPICDPRMKVPPTQQ